MHPFHPVSVDKYRVGQFGGGRLVGTVLQYADDGHRLHLAVDEEQLFAHRLFGTPAHAAGRTLHDVHLPILRLGRYPFTGQQLHVVETEELFTGQHFVESQRLLQSAFHARASIYLVRRITPLAQQRPIGRAYHFRHHRQGLDFLGPHVHIHIRPDAHGRPSAIVQPCIHTTQMVKLHLHGHRTEDEGQADRQLKDDTSLAPDRAREGVARMDVSVQRPLLEQPYRQDDNGHHDCRDARDVEQRRTID